jgi:pyruvate formate lyase activating enzyme
VTASSDPDPFARREPLSGLSSAPAHHAPTRRLAGWIPASLSTWPGRVSSALLISGCNLACPYCDSPSLRTATATGLEWDSIIRHIEERRAWLDGFVVTGGEPTEDPDLPSLLAALCEAGVPVRLDTNGTRPDVVRMLLAEQLVDYVALDIKAVPARYVAVSARRDTAALVAESAELLIRSGIDHEFRTTVFPGCVEPDDPPRIARSLRGGRLYALQQFNPSRAAKPGEVPVAPYEDDTLRRAAVACSVFLPTVARGLHSTEAD